jgi:hypothetical protein
MGVGSLVCVWWKRAQSYKCKNTDQNTSEDVKWDGNDNSSKGV